MDLRDTEHNSRDGLHIASLAGGWLALVAGFGGMRDMGEQLTFRPQLPPGWQGLRFALRVGQQRLRVDIGPDTVRYSTDGEATIPVLHLSDDDERELIQITQGADVERAWTPVIPQTPTPTQPAGRPPFSLRDMKVGS